MGLFPNSQSPKVDNELLSTRRISDHLPVFCTDKGYKFIDDVILTNTELLEAAFLPTYPDATLWSSTFHVQIDVVNATAPVDSLTIRRPLISEMQ